MFVSSQGPWLVDANTRKAFDTWLGSGSLIFGHGVSGDHTLTIDMLPEGATTDESLITNLEAAAGLQLGGIGFQTSGSSAIARSCRLARAATGKDKVAVIKSFWHGSDDQFLFSGATKVPISAGVPTESQGSSHWFESIDQFIKNAHLSDYAAVLVEPYQGADPTETTLTSTNAAWRSVLQVNNILLVADEIITGFRERFGSCTASRECKPDIVVFGKAIGNGYPVGVVLTTPRVADMTPKNFFWGGTFSASPTQMGAVTSHLHKLKQLDYKNLQTNLACIGSRLENVISAHQLKLELVKGCGFARIKTIAQIATPRAFLRGGQSDFVILRDVALKEGVYLGANGLIFPSVHNIEDHLS
jgi:glutamate-1-semialdehyde 2,1-aminomutase